ncbi:MAG: thermonuclease family protein [Ilumatobacteraceae bacterium]|jgi:micrococcal nuclease
MQITVIHTSRQMRRSHHLLLLVLFMYATLLSGCNTVSSSQDPNAAKVHSVVDGDTIDISIGGKTERVRLIGVNTPETKHPTKGIECFGPEASAYLEQLLPKGTALRVERDVEARDIYGRLLLYVYVADTDLFINLELVARGFAQPMVFEPNTAHKLQFAQAATQAERSNIGLWQACR